MVKLGIIKEDNIMSDNTNNGFPVPEEPLTREEQYLSAIAGVTEATEIPDKPLTRVEAYLNKIVEDGGDITDKLEAGTNIVIEETSDGKAKISASGEVSSEDTVARAEIAAIKDGTNIDSFGDVETALATKANTATTYTKTEVDTALGSKQDTISDLSTIRSGAALGATAVQPETGKGLSTNDYTNAEKSKLAGIEAQANKTTVDDSLSDSSTNPVQNKVVKSALDSKANANTTYTKTEVDTALGGKQNTIDSSHKLSADLVDDTSTTNKFATAAELEQIQTNKNNILTLINYFEFFPVSEKTNAGAGNVVNQALSLQAGKYRFTATVVGSGSSQLKFTVGENGETVDTKTWQNSVGTISEVYNLTSDTTWVTLYANAAVTYTDMSLKIEL